MSQDQASVHETLLKHGLDMGGQFRKSLVWETPVKIHPGVTIVEAEFGAYSYVAPHTELNYVVVGRYCSIGPHCRLFGSAHPTKWLSSHPFTHQNIFKSFVDYEPELDFEGYGKFTRIGHDVWIGTNAVILHGVKIGHGAVIGAGAVVAKDVPDYAVVVGNPGRVVKYRFDEALVARMLKLEWWRYDLPRHMTAQTKLPFDQPEAMLDYIEENERQLPKFDGIKKQLFNSAEGLAIRTIQPAPVSPSPRP